MTLEQLKAAKAVADAALALAVAAAEAKKDDAALAQAAATAKTTADAAQAALTAAEAAAAAPGDDLSKLPPDQLAKIIKDLRGENAAQRTKAKEATDLLKATKAALGLGDQESPEDKARKLAAEKETIAFENAVLSSAMEHGVSKDGLEYFSFLIGKAVERLADGEELPAERISEIAKEANSKHAKPGATTTPAGGAGSGSPAPGAGGAAVTAEQFANMGMMEKSKLYGTSPQVYEALMKEALQKKLIK